ncbi:MAG: carbon starvation protein A [Nitrospirae bacterium]|nr:carbon starvation protein A [Nitrospirota bacterium]
MNAVTLVFAALCVFAIGYRYYGLFIAERVICLNGERPTPAVAMEDGHDYHKTNKYVLFGHHFAAIAAAGPLLGPVLAAQFGYLPGALWILIGAVFAGSVHDTIVLFASVRHQGKSISKIAQLEVGKAAGLLSSIAVYFILSFTLAGLSLAVVNAMYESVWGTFTLFATIPIAFIMSLYMNKINPDDVRGASIIGVTLFILSIYFGSHVAASTALAPFFTFSKKQISLIIPAYGLIASILPVSLLLCPRDYLSSYLKIGTIVFLIIGIFIVNPRLYMPPLTAYIHGSGPIIPGHVFPFIFITIACGALSGFHCVIASGTTPKMIASEKDIVFVGFGAMLLEGMVAIIALIAACVLMPADYFAINVAPSVFAKLGMTPVHLNALSQAVGEQLQGRTGGGVSLAVGMAYIFASIPYMANLMSYWYHFAIMFEALFILTAVDTGTRAGRFFLQELIGLVYPKFAQQKWLPGIIVTSVIFTFSWGYLLYTGNITTIWPLFGMSNQLLAASALIICTTMLIRMGKAGYAWLSGLPGLVMTVITLVAGYLNITNNYLPKGNYLLAILSGIIMVLMSVIFVIVFMRWYVLLKSKTLTKDKYGAPVLEIVED